MRRIPAAIFRKLVRAGAAARGRVIVKPCRGGDPKVRPVSHYQPERVKAHRFLCMLAYRWSGICAEPCHPCCPMTKTTRQRTSIVSAPQRSEPAEQKANSKQNADGPPVHSFRSYWPDLATLTRNHVRLGEQAFDMLATPTAVQARALPPSAPAVAVPGKPRPAIQAA